MKLKRIFLLNSLTLLLLMSPLSALAGDPEFGGVNQFRDRWIAQDKLVGAPGVDRPYTWGPNIPNAATSLSEPYADSPGGSRQVLYLDKARMEINDPANGFVTTGLAVKELVSGMRQDGNNVFVALKPSQTQVAGDHVSANPNAPVYASFKNVVTLGNADSHSATNLTGQKITQAIAKNGSISTIVPPEDIFIGNYEPQTGHNIAAPFEAFKNQRGPVTDPATGSTLDDQPIYTNDPTSNVFGLAISEPYWVNTRIAGVDRTVLVQLFERRALTYNPALPANKVEMGNLGQHYYQWRYVESKTPAPSTTPPTAPNNPPNDPPKPPTTPNNPPKPSTKTPASPTFAGKWNTNIATLDLKQNGNQVTGNYSLYGSFTASINGYVENNTLYAIYADNPAYTLVFKLDSSGNTFTGNYGPYNTQWCGVRQGKGALPDGCGFSGSWSANFSTLQLKQDGDKLTGTYRDYTENFDKVLAGTVSAINGFPELTGYFENNPAWFVYFGLNLKGDSFNGNWLTDKQWCGVRSGPLPDGCGFSGYWVIKYKGLPYNAKLVQTGPDVTGYLPNTDVKISGTFSGSPFTLVGKYDVFDFKWVLVDSGKVPQQFQGQYTYTVLKYVMCGWRGTTVEPSPCSLG